MQGTPGIRLTRRSWTAVGGILPLVGVATIIAGCLAVTLLEGPAKALAALAVLVLGVAGGILWNRRRGAEATHGAVASARAAWARTRPDATIEPDGEADPRDIALALPRGWRVEAARGRLRFDMAGTTVRAETWVLRSRGARRAPGRREVVRTDARTDGIRVWIPLRSSLDSMLVTPSWVPDDSAAEPAWLPVVRDRVARHEDLLAALAIGDDRITLLALDDPRPETMLTRAQLVRDVAALIA